MAEQRKIQPHPTFIDEGGGMMGWLAAAYSPEDIKSEWDYLFDFESDALLVEQNYAARWTTDKERADPDALYDMFGCDPEDSGIDVTVYYWRVKPGWKPKNQYTQGPFLYYELP